MEVPSSKMCWEVFAICSLLEWRGSWEVAKTTFEEVSVMNLRLEGISCAHHNNRLTIILGETTFAEEIASLEESFAPFYGTSGLTPAQLRKISLAKAERRARKSRSQG